jgi:hypothetical protein
MPVEEPEPELPEALLPVVSQPAESAAASRRLRMAIQRTNGDGVMKISFSKRQVARP